MNETLPEPEIVKRARGVLTRGSKGMRWYMLFLAAMFFGFTIFMMHRFVRSAEGILGQPDVTEGFVKGFALGFIAVTFGSIGAFCIAKALIGFQKDFDEHAMLVKYHEELTQLIKDKGMSNKTNGE
jgi:hypothetical protein